MPSLPAALVAVLASAFPIAIEPIVCFVESFDSADTVCETRLKQLRGRGHLELVQGLKGNRRLALVGEAGFLAPVILGHRMLVSFELERGDGHGYFAVGTDRDPQHGFSRMLTLAPDGGLSLAGRPTGIRLRQGVRYHIASVWRRLDGHAVVCDHLRVSGGGQDHVVRSGAPVRALEGMPLPFLHGGPGEVFFDALHVRQLP